MRASPLVIAHRGASGYRPENTLAAFELAVRLGADYIEADVVATRDGVLVARHENELSETTDVAARSEFAERRRTREVDGREVTGWFTEDLTLEELRRLRGVERLGFRDRRWDGLFDVPTVEEVLALARRSGVGVYLETKHPTHFASLGLPLEPRLAELLDAAGFRGPDACVYLESFEPTSLVRLGELTDLPKVQLLEATGGPWDLAVRGAARTYAELANAPGLTEIASYARAVGCDKRLLVPEGPAGRLGPPTRVVEAAHAAGLAVHAWTFRSDAPFLAPQYGGDPGREFEQFLALGVDGFFCDFPEAAVAARERFRSGLRGT